MTTTELQDRKAVLISEINTLAPLIFGNGQFELMPQLNGRQKELFDINNELEGLI